MPEKLRALMLTAALTIAMTAGTSHMPVSAQAVGTIAGVVTLEPPPPPRRSANRYPGAATTAHQVQQVPAVVYLEGQIPGAPPGRAGTTRSMMQQDTAFVPAAVAVPVGGTVEFPNGDPFFHNVFSYSSTQRFDLGRYPEGQSKEVQFDRPGVVSVFCEVHDFMRGAIIVTENAYAAVVADDHTFSIEGVPEGEHTVVFWHPDYEEMRQSLVVTSGGTARVEVELRR